MKKFIIGVFTSLLALNANATLINIYETNSGLGSIAQAQSVIDNAVAADTSFESDNILFSDTQSHRNQFDAAPLLGGHNTTFVLTAFGTIDTSLYAALKFHHDDGIDVNIGGESLYTYNRNTALRNSGWQYFADTGIETFDLLFWENAGEGSIFVHGLLRDGQTQEVANFSSVAVPEPTTVAVLGLGLLALVSRRVKK
jgi:hypothetical protein